MPGKLAKNLKIRAAHRLHARKILSSVDELLMDYDGSDTTKDKIKRITITLNDKLATLKTLDESILAAIDEGNLEPEIEESEEFRARIHGALVKLQKCENSHGKQESPQGSQGGSVPSSSSNGAKLPKLHIKRFAGDPKNWQTFWDLFSLAVHKNASLTNVDKFNYLRSLLDGPALNSITGLPLTELNYKEAIEILTDRFGNKQIIISSHMEALLKLQPVNAMSNVKGIRAVLDNLEIQVRGLQALGIDSAQYGALLIPIFMEKLPEELRLIVSREHKDNWELTSVIKAVKNEVEARERCGMNTSVEKKSPLKKSFNPGNESTASALLSGNRGELNCLFCKGNHRASECQVVTNIDERREILKKQGRCFNCLRRGGHLARNCDTKIQCFKCSGRHHLAVCNSSMADSNNIPAGATASPALHIGSGMHVFLQTAQVNVSIPGKELSHSLTVRAIFDTGAQRSYINQKVVNTLKLKTVRTERLKIATFGDQNQELEAVNLVELSLTKSGTDFKTTLNAFAVPHICNDLQGQDLEWVKGRYPSLRNIEFADVCPASNTMQIDLLIGSDYIWDFFDGKSVRGEESGQGGPVAVSTKFGWVLSGPVENLPREKLSSIQFSSTHVLRTESRVVDDTLQGDLDRLWDLDSVGIRDKDTVLEAFEKNLSFEDGKYLVHLPWKEQHGLLPDNFENCVARLSSQLKRLRKDPEILKEYDSIIQDQLQSGIIEQVDCAKRPDVGRVHYLPHHGVVRRDALTTKLRVVFDASSRPSSDSPSLNECLYSGPALTPTIFNVLLRFREKRIALVGDIEKAFLSVGVAEEDRDVLRFLWVDSLEEENPGLMLYRFCRVVFGVNASPFLLNATLKYHISQYEADPGLVQNLLNSFYVDDLVTGERGVEECLSLYQKVYVLLFTCCSVRAVHLKLATDLSVDVFIRCLRRFASRRGLPELIISDNAKTFKAADKILSKLFSYPRVKKFPASKRIDWRFNVDRAPWWGGFFERLIQNTKRCLRKTLRNAKLNYDELHTVLVEVEGTLNSRPLTYVSSDDPEELLTPSHLMYGRRILSLPEVTGNRQASLDHTMSSEDLPRRRKYLGLLLEHFWRRWSREYVTELRNLHRQKSRPRSSIAVSEGDVVTVFEDNLPRSQWKLGRVEQLIHGADDRVRAAVVKVISKSGRPVTMKRPVQRLFPLEIPVVTNDEQPREEQIIDGIRPPRRLAARNADYIRRLVDQ